MKRIDKTKENIGVSGLDAQTRKKLFNDFIEAGGEVIKEKEERGLSDLDRDAQKKLQRQEYHRKQKRYSRSSAGINNKKTSVRPVEKPQKETLKSNSTKTSRDNKDLNRFQLFYQRIKIRLKLFFMKVADFSGYYFTTNFLNRFDNEYKTSLISMQITFYNLFKQNLRTGRKIIDYLDKMHPLYFELIELLSNAFDRTVANEILENYYNFQDIPQETRDLQRPLTEIFIKLQPLYLYRQLILSGLEKALTLQMRIEKKKFPFFSANKKRVKNDIYVIFEKLYPRLYWLICYYEGRIFSSDKDIEDTIPIPVENTPGKRKKDAPKYLDFSFSDSNLLEDNEKEAEEKDSDQKDIVPDPVRKGLDLMREIDPEKSYEFYTKNSIFKFINKSDKIFITNLLFDEFDREYSFILTTNKIKYNIIPKTYENHDFKGKFITIYNEIGKCRNRLKDYAGILDVFEKLKKEKPISSTQYIEYSNRLTALEKERKQAGNEARSYVKAFMEKLAKDLKTLINDMENEASIISNPQDVIIFETEIEGEKKLNAKNVHDAITYSYYYTMAFNYRLGPNGDLSGDIDIGEGEQNPLDLNKKSSEVKEQDAKAVKKKTILKELDDLL